MPPGPHHWRRRPTARPGSAAHRHPSRPLATTTPSTRSPTTAGHGRSKMRTATTRPPSARRRTRAPRRGQPRRAAERGRRASRRPGRRRPPLGPHGRTRRRGRWSSPLIVTAGCDNQAVPEQPTTPQPMHGCPAPPTGPAAQPGPGPCGQAAALARRRPAVLRRGPRRAAAGPPRGGGGPGRGGAGGGVGRALLRRQVRPRLGARLRGPPPGARGADRSSWARRWWPARSPTGPSSTPSTGTGRPSRPTLVDAALDRLVDEAGPQRALVRRRLRRRAGRGAQRRRRPGDEVPRVLPAAAPRPGCRCWRARCGRSWPAAASCCRVGSTSCWAAASGWWRARPSSTSRPAGRSPVTSTTCASTPCSRRCASGVPPFRRGLLLPRPGRPRQRGRRPRRCSTRPRRRAADGVVKLVELQLGRREPTRRAGPACRRCPLRDGLRRGRSGARRPRRRGRAR